jgi:hypothetical protein
MLKLRPWILGLRRKHENVTSDKILELPNKQRLSPFLMPQKKCDSLVFTCS